jgi:hypothetical protein
MNSEGYYICTDENGEEYLSSLSDCTAENEDIYNCSYRCGLTFRTPEEQAQHEETCPKRPGNENQDSIPNSNQNNEDLLGGGPGGPSPGEGSGNGTGNSSPGKSNVSMSVLCANFQHSVYNRPFDEKKCKLCLRGWKTIWNQSGLGEYNKVELAKDFGASLIRYGFEPIYSGCGEPSSDQYVPQVGDTRVWEPYPGQNPQAGHIDWYNGTNWCSDYVQYNKWYPGSKYKKHNVHFIIYR